MTLARPAVTRRCVAWQIANEVIRVVPTSSRNDRCPSSATMTGQSLVTEDSWDAAI